MTLIDKAEALATLRKHANGKTVLGGQVYQSLTLETALEAIAALPARGVEVKALVWQPIVKGARRPVGLVLLYRKSVTAEDKLVAAICKGTPETSDEILLGKWRDGAWRQWHTGWTVNGVTHWMTLPEPPEILAALAPTDAAQAREATLREAYDAIADYPRVSPDADEARHYDEQIEHSQSIILALIGEAHE